MKKNLFRLVFANGFFLAISLLINFFIPKYLSVESYAEFKTYALYIGYAGLLHFGYTDGMYLKYGGKSLNEIESENLSKNFISYAALEFVISLLCALFGLIFKNIIIFAFGIGVLANNLLGYFKILFQATGEFKLYGFALNAEKIATFFTYLVFIFLLQRDESLFYIGSQIVVEFLISFVLLFILLKKIFKIEKNSFDIIEIRDNIKSGFFLTLGNLINSFFTGIDRWFVKFLLSVLNFAAYSFAVSLESMINVFISPITIVFFNDFAKNNDINHIRTVKKIIILLAPIVICASFPCKFIIERFLTKYNSSIDVIFILFATQLFYLIIKSIYVNYYKCKNLQKKYFFQMCSMTVVSILLNIVLFLLFRDMVAIAVGTLCTSAIWFLVCEFSDKNLMYNFREYLFLLIMLCGYFVAYLFFNTLIGFGVYICLFFVSLLLIPDNVKLGISSFKKK